MPEVRGHFRNKEIQESDANEVQNASLAEKEAGVHTMLCSGGKEKVTTLVPTTKALASETRSCAFAAGF